MNVIQISGGKVSQGKSLVQWIDGLFSDETEADNEFTRKIYPYFRVRVVVPQCLPPRADFFEWILDMGRDNVDRVMRAEKIEPDPFFCLPERWLSVQECRYFMTALNENPNRAKLGLVRLMTQSPILIGEFPRETLRVVRLEGDEKHSSGYLKLFWGSPISGLEE